MKRITFKQEHINLKPFTGEDKTVDFSYRETLIGLLNAPLRDGMTIAEVEQRIRMRQQFSETAQDSAIIKDEDHALLVTLVENEKWRVPDKVILDFVNEIRTAPEVDNNASD